MPVFSKLHFESTVSPRLQRHFGITSETHLQSPLAPCLVSFWNVTISFCDRTAFPLSPNCRGLNLASSLVYPSLRSWGVSGSTAQDWSYFALSFSVALLTCRTGSRPWWSRRPYWPWPPCVSLPPPAPTHQLWTRGWEGFPRTTASSWLRPLYFWHSQSEGCKELLMDQRHLCTNFIFYLCPALPQLGCDLWLGNFLLCLPLSLPPFLSIVSFPTSLFFPFLTLLYL